MNKDNSTLEIKQILIAIYSVVGVLVAFVSFNQFWDNNGWLMGSFWGLFVAAFKGILWPIFIWFIF